MEVVHAHQMAQAVADDDLEQSMDSIAVHLLFIAGLDVGEAVAQVLGIINVKSAGSLTY